MITLLSEKLSKHYTYHSVEHIQAVIEAVAILAKGEQVNTEELLLLKIAALFHDAGFLYGNKNHEEKSCEIARNYLPKYGFSTSEITTVCELIMATKIPHQPENKLQEIIADADLYYLGGEDFFYISEQLYKELTFAGAVSSKQEWNEMQLNFIENHQYFTQTARLQRDHQKQIHLQIIREKMAKV